MSVRAPEFAHDALEHAGAQLGPAEAGQAGAEVRRARRSGGRGGQAGAEVRVRQVKACGRAVVR